MIAPPQRRYPQQRGTGLPDAVVFRALPNAYDGVFFGAALVLRPPAWGLSIWITPPATIPTPDANKPADTGGAQKVNNDAAISRAPRQLP